MYIEFNLYLWKIIFETDVVVLTIETIKLVFKPLENLLTLLKYVKMSVCEKRNIERHERGVFLQVPESFVFLVTWD